MEKVLFREEQQFRQWWYILLVFVATVPTLVYGIYALVQKLLYQLEVGTNPAPLTVLVLLVVLMPAMLWLFFAMKFELKIYNDRIQYRFFPMVFRYRTILPTEIGRFEIRKYKPIVDYGGWGVRRRFKWGRAYTVSGNIGLQIYLANGKKILFGTQRSQAILHAMNEMMKTKQV